MEQTKQKNELLKENTEISKKKMVIYNLIFIQISKLIEAKLLNSVNGIF